MPRIPAHIVLPILILSLAPVAPAFSAESAPSVQSTVKLAFIGLEAHVPAAWTMVPPATDKRLAQFKISTPGEGMTAEVIVYYFGKGEGGTAEANIERWQGQFVATENKPVLPPVVSRFQSNGMAVTTAELHGAYARGIGVGPVGVPKPDQTLLAAVVETPEGNLIIQLHGKAASVSTQKEAFLAFVRSIRGETI
ncbi:MAG: hypothetical protein Q8N54_01945 [Sulfurimicrobium sp.]|jgi:hypothetical protein|nr:hypothetical protein [Sulfurimicrobium sp.]MDO9190626.1 hypothetical protein [Sulfurimicrobium sp.]MDP1705260.1 hypothetical protein [Sulfurimicrobium sp.]MDP2199848.1 hypothetical protein [Sulfurimicrobium sp.]MDP2961489.1 hypothetical protein [Sulfurimicrobium sp.]